VKYASRATERERFVIASVDTGLRASLLKDRGREQTERDEMSWRKVRTEIFPFDAEFRHWYGFRLWKNGRIAEAIVEIEKVLELDHAFVQAYNSLGYCYASLGEGEKAIQVLERYAGLLPGNRDPFNSLAECLTILGRYDEAMAKAQIALQIEPDNLFDRLVLARVYFMKEECDSALRWSLCPTETPAAPSDWANYVWWHAWYLLWSGRVGEAEETLRQSAQKASSAYRSQKLTESDRNDILGEISYLRGWCAYERGDWKNARLQIADWEKRKDSRWVSQFYLGLIELHQGKADSIEVRRGRIRDTLAAFSQRDAENSSYYWELERWAGNALEAAYLLAARRPAEIRANWTPQFHTQIPDSTTTASWPLSPPWANTPHTILQVGWIPIPFDILPRAYIECDMIDSAIASYELAIKKPGHWLGPIIPRYYYRLARLYEQQGKKEKAIENYTQFLKVWGKADPIYKEPADARARLARLKRG
jgi:tetratricopeptide (TPR) repeat protein